MARTAPADTVPVERVPAAPAAPGPDPDGARGHPYRAEARRGASGTAGPDRGRPAQDTTGTVGSGTIQ